MRRWGTLLVLLVAVLSMAANAVAVPRDTTVRTIDDRDGDNLLEFAPGEDHCVFTPSLAPANPDCPAARLTRDRPDSVLNFLQLTDFQMVDEESPARVETVDPTQREPGLNPFSAAYRPQESLSTQVTEAMVRQARNTTSPITGEPLDLTILTGDNADNQQFNETRWFIDMLDGTTGNGNPDPEMDIEDRPGEDRKIDPDSGVEALAPACNPAYEDNGLSYDGVRGGGGVGPDAGFYEPDGTDDGDGYTPDRVRNEAETLSPQGDVTVRDFPGLFEQAQEPFEAVGLGMPWYSAFGNHDALVQGNSSDAYFGPGGPAGLPPPNSETVNPAFDVIARGCAKPTKLPPGIDQEALLNDPGAFLTALTGPGTEPATVPPDPRRCFVAKDEPTAAATPCDTGGWIQQHSRTTGLPAGHGFEPFGVDGQAGQGRPGEARINHDGYYSFVPREDVRFVVLDTITDECTVPVCSEGSVDHTQYQWLEDELDAAQGAGQYVLVFSHHTERTTRMESTDETERPIHYGERLDRKERTQPPRPVRPDAPPESTLEDMFCRHENVIAHVTGHEHENYVLQHNCEDPPPDQNGRNPFVEISTSAHIDWPQQSREIELVEDGGKLALVLTILDHDGPPYPGGPPPSEEPRGQASEQPLRLASIAREIAYNDYQGNRGARGKPSDRNVIVPTPKQWPPPDPTP